MEGLYLNNLPELSQQKTIREVATALWQQKEVIALWLGGSLASGTGDAFSDIDLRIAVAPCHLTCWEAPPFEQIFVHTTVVGQLFLRFGDDAFLHHLLLSNGELFDFCVQSTESELTPELRQILGCRSDLFASRLQQNQTTSSGMEPHPPNGEMLRRLLIDFWINTYKHCKALYRDLDLLCIRRIQLERDLLLKLWYIHSSGRNYSAIRQTMHSMTEVAYEIRTNVPHALCILGAPMRNRQELIRVIELNRNVVAELGRQLARRYSFEYPSILETTVLRSWQDFAKSLDVFDENGIAEE